MAAKPKPIDITEDTELLRLIDSVSDEPVRIVRNGVLYQISRVDEDDIAYEPDPEYVRKVLRETAGTWADLDIDKMIEDLYQARLAGSRPADRP